MKNLKIYLILGLSALFVLSACNKDEPAEDVNPVLTLSQTTLTVDADGGVVSVAYQVENIVEGSIVSVDLGDVTWITNVDATDSTIDLTVEANSDSDSRTATLTVSYPGAEDVILTVVQEAVEVQYDYNYDLSEFIGYLYPEYGDSGEDMFYIWLSDLEFSSYGTTQAGGHYYNFPLFVNEADGSTLPTGTYTYSANYGGNMVFSGYNSRYLVQYEGYFDSSYLTDGSLTVSAEGDIYTIEGTVTDSNEEVHLISYTGRAEISSFAIESVDFEATAADANYYSHTRNVMNVDLMFTDMPFNGSAVTPPGIYLALDTFMPYDEDGKIATGEYTVSSTNDSFTINPGKYSYVRNFESESYYTYGSISSGSMTVTESGDGYYIVCDFVTSNGATVKCTYTGSLSVDHVPGASSTLDSDITVNIRNDASATADDYGNYYGNGGKNWYIYISSYGEGEDLEIDLNARWGNTDNGIPSGTYTASSSTTPAIGEYLYGYKFYSLYNFGTWYYEYENGGYLINSAPAISGDITITNNGNNSYKIVFACTDDIGYTWSGEWEGTITPRDFSTASISAASSSKSFGTSKLSKQKTSSMAMETKAAQREDRLKVVTSEESKPAVSKTLKLQK